MKIIFAGGREVPADRASVLISHAYHASPFYLKLVEVVHGGARGIDKAAGRCFTPCRKETVFPADWKTHGKAAGPIRNKQMAEYADALIAIWDGKSRGTKNMIETMQKLGKPVYVHRYD